MNARSLHDIRARFAAKIVGLAGGLGFETEAVARAFAAVRREEFLTPAPWEIFAGGAGGHGMTSDPAKLYDDVLIVLDARRGINNGQPSLHAAWMAAVAPQPGETIVQIGAGTGYYTAILAELVGEAGRVEAYEIDGRLARSARTNLASLARVRLLARSGLGPLPPADVIYAAASVEAPPMAWLDALKPGGRLIVPWQPSRDVGRTLLVRREPSGFRATMLFGVAFIACVGADGARESGTRPGPRALGETRSLHLRREREPDATATAILDEVWFSAAEP
ncbi:protein-L-isoaspartate O-methyltransferase family protein [Enterovirga rhinocerotis]|nr:SAM-dependent methyltransferase [Enterovirga rhinocerotis]